MAVEFIRLCGSKKRAASQAQEKKESSHQQSVPNMMNSAVAVAAPNTTYHLAEYLYIYEGLIMRSPVVPSIIPGRLGGQ